MKSLIVKKNKRRIWGVKKISGKKLELYNFYELVGFYKRMCRGEEIK